jgi:hypothetical protein
MMIGASMSRREPIQFLHHDARFAGTLYKPDAPNPAPVLLVLHPAQVCSSAAYLSP